MPDLPQRPSLEHLRKQAARLEGIERAPALADPVALSELLRADPTAATARSTACRRRGAERDEDAFYHACEDAILTRAGR